MEFELANILKYESITHVRVPLPSPPCALQVQRMTAFTALGRKPTQSSLVFYTFWGFDFCMFTKNNEAKRVEMGYSKGERGLRHKVPMGSVYAFSCYRNIKESTEFVNFLIKLLLLK